MLRRLIPVQLALVSLLLATSACAAGGRNPAPATPAARLAPDELCPPKVPDLMPTNSDGTIPAAPVSPALRPSTAAWVCHYSLPMSSSEDGFFWQLDGQAETLPAAELGRVDELIGSAVPLSPGTPCTADAGPLYVLVVDDGQQQTAVIVEDFGCRRTQLNDLPLGGELAATSEGSVNGNLAAPELARQLREWV
ncbi:hypothetical protein ACF3NT_00480 [Naumannella halotolerans]|uniref:DUF3558 domain-containing protein n=1 Tax=Naumannella halotolerans TaxID=993414 RepID=A0A4R7J729_9ACTN|nr:hypothetical protein [Naumannella halotolerans]TDT32536.1 hypothetical protein CLV29_0115 [Naumannella halotolerans]